MLQKAKTEVAQIDQKAEGKLGLDADEADDVKKVDSSTYWKIFNDTGGLIFWLLAAGNVIVLIALWDQSSKFWSNFASFTPEEQAERATE